MLASKSPIPKESSLSLSLSGYLSLSLSPLPGSVSNWIEHIALLQEVCQ
jgi:hypothetical protein